MSDNSPVIAFYPTNELPSDKNELKSMMSGLAEAAMEKFFEGKNENVAKAVLKFGCSVLAGQTVTKLVGGMTPLGWLLRGFGTFPSQYLTYRALPVLEFSKGMVPMQTFRGVGGFVGGNGARIMVAELSLGQRLLAVGRVAATRFVLVTIAFQGGYMVGTLINDKMLDDSSKNVIGGVINQIVNEGGWRLAFPKVFRDAIGMASYSPTVDLSEM
jgi:hypothetical protein